MGLLVMVSFLGCTAHNGKSTLNITLTLTLLFLHVSFSPLRNLSCRSLTVDRRRLFSYPLLPRAYVSLLLFTLLVLYLLSRCPGFYRSFRVLQIGRKRTASCDLLS
jgi:hypothetical protein